MPSILRMADKGDKYVKRKAKIFDLPMRLGIIGKSGCGKTSVLGSLLLLNEFYNKDFQGDNIYIISNSLKNDFKLQAIVKRKNIPEDNLYQHYDEIAMQKLYDELEENYRFTVKAGDKPEHTLVIFDDCSFSGDLKNKSFGAISRFVCNGRKPLISTIQTSQKYSQLSTTSRENFSGLMLSTCSNKQLELIESDCCYVDKKAFNCQFRCTTNERFKFFIVNFSNDRKGMYQNDDFQSLCMCPHNAEARCGGKEAA